MILKIFLEDMVYNNFFLRFSISLIILFLYYSIYQDIFYLFTLGCVIYVIIFYEVYKFFKNLPYLIYFYLIISFINFSLYLYNYFDIFIFNLLIFIIVIFDTSSYLIGKAFGRNKIFKKISPNKTLEGYIGGILSTNAICLIILLLNFSILNIHYFILINLIVIFSITGDLIQSFFKRKNLIKDSSNFLPGHGGFFDRFDSFISSIMLLNLYNYLYL
tara:strand:+ start:822 stop:1472 length:651 start_codon:yes stop_codon:yes gene_type:complete